MSRARFFIPEFIELIDNNDSNSLAEFIEDMHPTDLSDVFLQLDKDYAQRAIALFSDELLLDIFEELETTDQADVLKEMDRERISCLLNELSPDIRVDLFQEFDEKENQLYLDLLDEEEKDDVKLLLKYDEDSAGGTMTTEHAHILDTMNVGQAMEFIKQNAEEFETVYYIYVLDQDGVLKGVISLKDFICASGKTPITEVMVKDPIYIHDQEDQEEAARIISKYNLLALPVLDKNHHLVGMITHDDVLDIIEEETTEDMVKFGGASHLDDSYLNTNIIDVVKTRVWWLVGFLFMASISSFVIHGYEEAFVKHAWLVFFIPMLVGTAGNAGTQSATIIIRSMATGEIERSDSFAILRKEMIIGLLLGSVIAIFSILRTYPELGNFYHSFILSISLIIIVSLSTFVGSVFPLLAERLNIDPALMSSPLLATFIDVVGLLIYFQFAKFMLGF